MWWLNSGLLLYGLLVIQPIRTLMESVMIAHMLLQFPLLIFAGWLIGKQLIRLFPSTFRRWNINGVPGIILIVFITTYWMIPRTLDEALNESSVEVFKFISLPIVGILLADSWSKLKALGKSFIFLNYLSMFALMGWLYIDSPIQICNNYLVDEQKMLGWGFIFITGLMVMYILQYVFTDHSEETEPP